MRLRLALLVTTMTCVDPSPPPRAAEVASVPPTVVVIGDQELEHYERGRRAELHRLRASRPAGDSIGPAALDSIGALAAGVAPAVYDSEVRLVENYLRSHRGAGSGRLAQLDSLRVERLVLLLKR